MSSSQQEANKIIARRLAEEVFSQGMMRTFGEILAETYLNHNIPVPGIPGTKEGFRGCSGPRSIFSASKRAGSSSIGPTSINSVSSCSLER